MGDCTVQSRSTLWHAQVCFGPAEGTLVTGGYDQAVRVWDMRSRSWDAIQTLKPFADSVTSVAISAMCAAMLTELRNQPIFKACQPHGHLQ